MKKMNNEKVKMKIENKSMDELISDVLQMDPYK